MAEFRRSSSLRLQWRVLVRAAAIGLIVSVGGAVKAQQSGAAESAPVAIRNLARAGAFAVTNRAAEIALSRHVGVQRLHQGQWVDVTSDLALVATCGAPAGDCVSLRAGATITPVPWNGLSCGSQCPASCRANVHYGPARIRFVLSVCGSGQKVYGPPFELPAYSRARSAR